MGRPYRAWNLLVRKPRGVAPGWYGADLRP